MRTHARLIAGLAASFVLVAACSSGGGAGVTAAPSAAPVQAESPVPTPVPTMQVITAPPATPKVMTDGEGDEHVTGVITSAVLSTPYTRTSVDDTDGAASGVTEELRGGIVTFTFDVNDPRVNGTGHFAFSLDAYTNVGSEWGTLELTTEQGAWNGPCSGGSWAEGDGLLMSCWLAGSGDYEGWTYYIDFTGPSNGDENGNGIVEGIVYQGVPPTPEP